MSAPNLTISAQPEEASSVVYGALAAKTSDDSSNGQLSLVLTITNHEPSPVHLNQVKVSFVGPPNISPSTIAADLTIQPNQIAQWYFQAANNIILPVPRLARPSLNTTFSELPIQPCLQGGAA